MKQTKQMRDRVAEKGSEREAATLAQSYRTFEREHLMPLLTGKQMRAFQELRVERRRAEVMEARRAAGRESGQAASVP